MKDTLVRKYQDVHRQKFGESITAEEAERNLSNLIELVRSMASIGKASYGK